MTTITAPTTSTSGIMRRAIGAALALFLALGTLTVVDAATNEASAAGGCEQTFSVATTSYTYVVHPSGYWVALQKDWKNFQQGVHVHVNGTYYGFYAAPLNLGPDMYVGTQIRNGTTIGLDGRIKQTNSPEMYLQACNGWQIWS